MKKYIHYCWFGDKEFPKLAKQCLESWKKFLPEYEIIKWSEENVDLDECPFIRGAYDNKKWAFVADYVRAKALKEYGGIYFDTDMEIIKDITPLLNCNTFLGVEDTGYVAVGVWYEKEKNSQLAIELLNKYQSMKSFDVEKVSDFSIPILLSEILKKKSWKEGINKIQHLEDGIDIYPREYFYPYSYDRTNNIFTENTCMIHYYDASWIPKKDQIELKMVRILGKKKTFFILKMYRKIKDIIRKVGKVVLFPIVIHRKKKQINSLITNDYLERINKTIENINKINEQGEKYIVLHNKFWIGVTNATIELFKNTIDCGELYRKEDIKRIGGTIINSNIEQVIFSSFSIGDKDLVKYIKKNKKAVKIKTYWHGSHSQVLDTYGWQRNIEIIRLHKKGLIDVMGSCKESLLNFYIKENFKAKFITNKVETDVIPTKKKNSKQHKVGLYAAKCDDWRKNMFTQMLAASMINNVILDMVPLNDTAKEFANIIGLKLEGEEKPLPREKLIKRMSENDVNLYVTFSECSPMLPLESFEMKVPCITGNNHHYFKNNKIEDYIVVKNEANAIEIAEKIKKCIDQKDEILKLYSKFQKENLKQAKNDVNEFIKM